MIKTLFQFFLMLCIGSLVGCATPTPFHTDVDEATLPALPQKPAKLDGADSVRSPGDMKVYPIGRYEDPEDPDLMHEAHTIYRQETSSQWNTAPNAPTYVPLGPTVAAAVPDQDHISLTAELEQKVNRENQLLQTTYEQNEKLSQEIKALQATGHLPVAVPPASSPVATPQPQPQTSPSPQSPPVTSAPKQESWFSWLSSH